MFRRLSDRLQYSEQPLRFLGVLTRLFAHLRGVHGRFGATPDFRWTIRNDRTVRASVRRVLE